MQIDRNRGYTLEDKKKKIHHDREDLAKEIDRNKNHTLEDREIKDYLVREEIIKREHTRDLKSENRIVKDFKLNLMKEQLPQFAFYPSYDQVMSKIKEFESKYPGLVKAVSIGKTFEGRDIMAMKISGNIESETSKNPGFLITGLHHAREWPTLLAPLATAEKLLENYGKDEKITKRLDSAELWVVPLVNPDGYEFSRSDDNFWRKNRRPIYPSDVPPEFNEFMIPGGDGTLAKGVDINRNYDDGNPEHSKLHRPDGDSATSVWDDFSATSDVPRRETYRGPYGCSEKESQAILNLWMKKENVKGILNHHTYGKVILYPWSVSKESTSNKETYLEICNKMSSAMDKDPYVVKQSSTSYLASGIMDDFAQANNRLAITIEMGTNFHGEETKEDIDRTNEQVFNANMAFLDWLIEHKNTLMTER